MTDALNTLQGMIEDGINSVADPLIKSSASPLSTLADGLTGVVDIGLNVQSGPKIQPAQHRLQVLDPAGQDA